LKGRFPTNNVFKTENLSPCPGRGPGGKQRVPGSEPLRNPGDHRELERGPWGPENGEPATCFSPGWGKNAFSPKKSVVVFWWMA
jgi:hypothetical protein